MFQPIGRLATSQPRLVVGLMALIAAFALLFSPGLADRLSSQGFTNANAESTKALDHLSDATGADVRAEFIALVTVTHGHVDSAHGRRIVAKVERRFERDPEVAQVRAPFAEKSGTKKTNKDLIAKDGRSAIVVANLEPHPSDHGAYDRLKDAFSAMPEVQLGGGEVTRHTVSATISKDLKRSEMMAFPLLFVIAVFVFRGLIAALLPLLVGAITIPVTFALIRMFDQITDLSVFALNLTTGLGLGLAIDYSLLLVTRYREEVAAGASQNDAVRQTVATAGRTVAFSATTVAAAIGAMMIFPLKFLYSMGIGGATVALVSAIVALALVPALLVLLGPWLDRFAIPRRPAEHSMALWYRLARGVMARPMLVTFCAVALLTVLTLPVLKIDFTSVDATVLGKTVAPRVVQERVDNGFPPGDANTSAWVLIRNDRYDTKDLARDARWLKRDSAALAGDRAAIEREGAMLTAGAYAADPLRRQAAAADLAQRKAALVRRGDALDRRKKRIDRRVDRLDRFTDRLDAYAQQAADLPGVKRVSKVEAVGNGAWKFDVFPSGTQYSRSAQSAIERVRALRAPADRWVGGNAAAFVDQRDTLAARAPVALGLIALLTFVVLFLMTGSVVLPIKTFVMNLLTLGATFGVLVWIFQEGHLESLLKFESQGAMEMTQPVLIFALAFGLATDYGVFLLSRIKELHDAGLPNAEAVAVGVSRTGRVISSAAVLFCVAIITFSTSGIVFIKELGIGGALAVAIDATIVRALLVPALMAILGDYNWWAPRWMKRIYERFGISEGPSAPPPGGPPLNGSGPPSAAAGGGSAGHGLAWIGER